MASKTPPPRPPGPPYMTTRALLGGIPSKSIDVPVSSCFLCIFILAAVCNMTIFKLNKKRGHKFLPSALCYAYCMCRIVSMCLRISWSFQQDNAHLGIAATIFVAAGILLLYIVNLVFAQRILRAAHPRIGWSKLANAAFKLLFACIPITLIMVITATVQSFYTLNESIVLIDHTLQLSAMTFFLLLASLPMILVTCIFLIPTSRYKRPEKFGTGRWRTKMGLLFSASALFTSGASWRLVTNFMPSHEIGSPPWYYGKEYFWVFNIGVEVVVLYAYLIFRVDLRFYVQDGSRSPGDYSRAKTNPYGGRVYKYGDSKTMSPTGDDSKKELLGARVLRLTALILLEGPLLLGGYDGRTGTFYDDSSSENGDDARKKKENAWDSISVLDMSASGLDLAATFSHVDEEKGAYGVHEIELPGLENDQEFMLSGTSFL